MKITSCKFGTPIRCNGSHGDLWVTAWADDGELYCASDDTHGFNKSCNSNLAFHKLAGAPPDIKGETINPMSEYGKLGETLDDGAMWKACGLTCIDGVLYMTVSRHVGSGLESSPYAIQEAWHSSIISSRDKGRTWTPAREPCRSMFPGHAFATPTFVQYGKDGVGRDHEADVYVYAVSSKGVWNNGAGMTMGRVRRDAIARLDAADWEFVVNYNDKGKPIWGCGHETARLIFWRQRGASMTGIHYIKPLGIYILPQWYYTHLDDPDRRWKASCIELYQSPTPWGPWELFHAQRFEPEGWYNPHLPAKFISEDGKRLWMFVAGDWTTAGDPEGYYMLFMVPVELDAQ